MDAAAPPLPIHARRARLAVFVVAAAISAFDLGSLVYLRRASVDFVERGRLQDAPPYALGSARSWRGEAPGALVGWAVPEPAGTWSTQPTASLGLRLPARPASDLLLTVNATAFVNERRLPVRNVTVDVNGVTVAQWRFDRGHATERTARIARALVAERGIVHVTLRFAESRSPRDIDGGADQRRLGLLVHEWRLAAAP